ncbi:MAG: efflux RND transporter periplasmic adaptor subunit [Verrucomicrobia bacterium]|nr:efflux RND transporter periplasmic adaptor subunit [Verrucomicrobiota bacterium]
MNEAPPSPGPLALKRRPALWAGVAILLLLLWWLLAPSKGATAATEFYEVKRGDFTVSVVEGGTLAAVSEVVVRSEVEGTARIIYIAKEGSFVKKGDLLVELDSAQAQDQVNQQRINTEKAANALTTAQLTLDIQRSQTNSDISAAKLKLQLAELELRKFREGGAAVSLLEASNSLLQVEAQLKVNEEKYRNSTNLFAKNYETKQTVDADRVALLNSINAMIKATNTLFLLQEFDLKKQEAQAVAAVTEAEKELERVLQQSERRIAQYESDLITQSNTLVLNQRKLERDLKNLEACRILAPQDGLVVYATGENRFSSESLIEEGATVRNRQELIKLPDTSRMKVTVKIHESNINLIRAGQNALVVLDSMPDSPFRATVERVALLPDSQSRWGNPNLKLYNTEVVITDPLPDVKPGVSAKAEIIITNIANAISVPIQAVTTLKGRPVVYVVRGGKPEPRPVELGLFNTRFIQIVSGLEPGERVLLSPPLDTGSRDLEGSLLADSEKARTMATNAPAIAPVTGAAASPAGSGRPAPGAEQVASVPDAPRGDRAAGQEGAPRRGGFNQEEMIRQYDKDGDGQLNEAEQSAMREAMRARFAQGGPGGGGPPGFDREAMMKEFDKDGDGQLSEEERTAMREAMRQRFGGQGGPGGGGGRNRAGGQGGGPEGGPAPQSQTSPR